MERCLLVHEWEELILLKFLHYLEQPIDSPWSLSQSNAISHTNKQSNPKTHGINKIKP